MNESSLVVPQLHQQPSTGLFWYVTSADEVTNFEQQPASSNVWSNVTEDKLMHGEEVVVKQEVDGAVHG